MSLDRTLALAWKTWRQLTPPLENYRNGRTTAPSYMVEHDLDHFASGLYSVGSRVFNGRGQVPLFRLDEDLAELASIHVAVDQLPANAHRNRLLQYLNSMEHVVNELRKHQVTKAANDLS